VEILSLALSAFFRLDFTLRTFFSIGDSGSLVFFCNFFLDLCSPVSASRPSPFSSKASVCLKKTLPPIFSLAMWGVSPQSAVHRFPQFPSLVPSLFSLPPQVLSRVNNQWLYRYNRDLPFHSNVPVACSFFFALWCWRRVAFAALFVSSAWERWSSSIFPLMFQFSSFGCPHTFFLLLGDHSFPPKVGEFSLSMNLFTSFSISRLVFSPDDVLWGPFFWDGLLVPLCAVRSFVSGYQPPFQVTRLHFLGFVSFLFRVSLFLSPFQSLPPRCTLFSSPEDDCFDHLLMLYFYFSLLLQFQPPSLSALRIPSTSNSFFFFFLLSSSCVPPCAPPIHYKMKFSSHSLFSLPLCVHRRLSVSSFLLPSPPPRLFFPPDYVAFGFPPRFSASASWLTGPLPFAYSGKSVIFFSDLGQSPFCPLPVFVAFTVKPGLPRPTSLRGRVYTIVFNWFPPVIACLHLSLRCCRRPYKLCKRCPFSVTKDVYARSRLTDPWDVSPVPLYFFVLVLSPSHGRSRGREIIASQNNWLLFFSPQFPLSIVLVFLLIGRYCFFSSRTHGTIRALPIFLMSFSFFFCHASKVS